MNKQDNQKNINEAIELMNSELEEVFVGEMQNTIKMAIEKAKDVQIGKVESVIHLNNDEKQHLDNFLENVFRRKIKITYRLNKNLLAGLKIIVGDWKLDASLAHQLVKMKQNIGGISV